MDILLIRHLESTKNVRNAFSSDSVDEALATQGSVGGKEISYVVKSFIQKRNSTVFQIYTSAALRCRLTAEILGQDLQIPVSVVAGLHSINPGKLAGVSEVDAQVIDPKFMKQLTLYRSGLFNAYKMSLARSETIKQAERRIRQAIDSILQFDEESLKVIILSRSPITASVIRFARESYSYPENFYGFVPLDLGGVSWIERQASYEWVIHGINFNPKMFASVFE